MGLEGYPVGEVVDPNVDPDPFESTDGRRERVEKLTRLAKKIATDLMGCYDYETFDPNIYHKTKVTSISNRVEMYILFEEQEFRITISNKNKRG